MKLLLHFILLMYIYVFWFTHISSSPWLTWAEVASPHCDVKVTCGDAMTPHVSHSDEPMCVNQRTQTILKWSCLIWHLLSHLCVIFVIYWSTDWFQVKVVRSKINNGKKRPETPPDIIPMKTLEQQESIAQKNGKVLYVRRYR